ncbi:MAG: cysteine desulfurase [Thermoprotei archaeon]
MSLKPEYVRPDFPVLDRTFGGQKLAYLDNAATTQKPRQVIEALVDFYSKSNANVHRGAYQLAGEATELYEGAREKVAGFIGGKPEGLVFVRGATEAINLVAYSLGKVLRPGDKVLTTMMEHHSNIVPWQFLEKYGVKLEYVNLTENGELSIEDFESKLDERVKLFTFTHVSNVLGTVNAASYLTDKAHKNGSLVLLDCAQSVPHMPVSASEIGADFYAFSGHKMLGPMGIGCLYAKPDLLEHLDPFHGGGDMIKQVHLHESSWNDVPHKFEAGTPNVADAVGLGAAVDYLTRLGMSRVEDHERKLTEYVLKRLGDEKIKYYGPSDHSKRGGLVSFNIEGAHPHDVATLLDERAIAVRAGHHCAQPLMEWLGVDSTTRASFYIYNTMEEIDRLMDALIGVRRLFSKRVRAK